MILIMKRFSLPVMASALLFSGCATVFNNKTQNVNLMTSNGSKITATVDGQSVEVPGIAHLTRSKSDKIVTTDNPNCNKQTLAPRQFDFLFLGNILGGTLGLFSSTTDYSTEKMWRYDQNIMINCK